MTEIPEHLLKRSKERRAAIGGEESAASGGEESAPAASAPAETTAATPAETPAAAPAAAEVPVAPEPEPMRPEVAAYHSRRRIPYWAMPVLAFLPLWAYMYQATLEPPPAGEETPLVIGEEVYNSCSSCHGSSGQGTGSFPALDGVLETWPEAADHVAWVRLGSAEWPGDTYGATDKPKNGGMPSHATLTDEEIAAVVLYERVQFGGSTEEEEEVLVSIVEGEAEIADLGVGKEMKEQGLDASVLATG